MAAPDHVKAAFYLWNPNLNDPVPFPDQVPLTHLYIGLDFPLNPPTGSRRLYEDLGSTTRSPQFTTFVETVRQRCPDIKFLLSIGGDPSFIANIASIEDSRQLFIHFIVNLANQLNFDGADLRWLYPVTSDEMNNLGILLTELKADAGNLLLSAAVFYSSDYWSSLKYPFQAISASLDWINVLAFDLYTPDSSPKLTGPPAPLYNPKSCELNGDNGVRAWIEAGVPANKLVYGLPFFGHGWSLVNPDNHEIFSPALGPAPEIIDPIPYSQILDFITQRGAVHRFDPSYVTDYCYAGETWIGYDGEDSVKTKVIYAKKKELHGEEIRGPNSSHKTGLIGEDCPLL